MSPAPANESASLMSPFFTASTAAAPLSERDCNGAILCPSVSKAAPASTACAIRRGASFLDADDACLAFSDKTSFLIPEDSYLPGQENYASAQCVPGALPPVGRGTCTPYPSAGGVCSASLSTAHAPAGSGLVVTRVPRMSTPFMLLDPPVFGCEDEFAAASVCFEKAVQALEMVERPSVPPHGSAAGRQGSSLCVYPAQPADGLAAEGRQSANDEEVQQPSPDLDPSAARRVSSLSSSPELDNQGGAGEQPFPAMPYEQGATSAQTIQEHDGGDGAEVGVVPSSWRHPLPAQSHVQEHGLLPIAEAAMMHAAAVPFGHDAANAPAAAAAVAAVNAAPLGAVVGDVSGSYLDSAIPVAPAAPPPAPRAFHHKTGGPCDHCGATESPQWRRGPPAKPMLCNACGTRFRRTNQLNPVAALSPAGRAAAAAAAAAAAPAAKRNAASKRDPPYIASTSAKRGRSSASY